MGRRQLGARLHLRARCGGSEAVWYIIDRDQRISTGCGAGDIGGAEAALAAHIAERSAPPRDSARRLDRILIADVLTSYLAARGPRVANPEFLIYTAEPVLAWGGQKSLDQVRAETCAAYVDWRTAQGVSIATARHDLKTLRAAIRHWHAAHGPLPSVPHVTLPPAPPARTRWLRSGEAARLILAAWRAPRWRHVARLALIGLYTGTRPGAILRLRWTPALDTGWIDLDNGLLHRAGAGQTQSRKRQPTCPIPARLMPHLVRWRRADLAAGVPWLIHYAGRPVGKLRRSWAGARAAAELGADVTPHTLRHTAITWRMQAGVDRHEICGFFGIGLEMLEGVYGHHHPSYQHAAANTMRRRSETGDGPEMVRKQPGNVVKLRQSATRKSLK